MPLDGESLIRQTLALGNKRGGRTMKKLCTILAVASASPLVVQAQTIAPVTAPAVAPTIAAPEAPKLMLPVNTEIAVTPNDNLTTKGAKEGDTFMMSTVFDVMYNGYVVIPRGTPGQGHISWRTGKGAFGKSAKMDVSFDWLDLNGRRIALTGKHRQEGQGNTGAAVGAVVAVGVFGAFVTGKSAKIPHGMQLSARTAESLPIVIPTGATPVPTAGVAPAATTAAVIPAATVTAPVK
jgi:hypothetical protein